MMLLSACLCDLATSVMTHDISPQSKERRKAHEAREGEISYMSGRAKPTEALLWFLFLGGGRGGERLPGYF